ncbi:hypothetical protein GCM10018987_56840 [Streptomyces cremeus]
MVDAALGRGDGVVESGAGQTGTEPAGSLDPGTSEQCVTGVKAELDRLMEVFLGAFDNRGGRHANVGVVREVFIPEGMIISNVAGQTVIYDLDGFVAPRERILSDGTLTEFSEWEVAERTEIFGTVAHRFSEYGKSGFRDGEWFEGAGRKTTQFLRTPDGWRMSSMAWDDVR